MKKKILKRKIVSSQRTHLPFGNVKPERQDETLRTSVKRKRTSQKKADYVYSKNDRKKNGEQTGDEKGNRQRQPPAPP